MIVNPQWEYKKFDDIALDVDKSGPDEGETFDYIEIGSINNMTKEIEEVQTITSEEASSRASRRLKSGDVLISRTRPKLNGVAIVPEAYDNAIGTSGFYVVRSTELIPKFVYYYAQTDEFIKDMSNMATGSSYPSVNLSKIREYEIPVPAKAEQRKIVSKIDELVSKIDSGVSELNKTDAILSNYKESYLYAAIEGRITEQWRGNKDDLEDSEDMLARTKELRENECGGKYDRLADPEDIPEYINIPSQWSWVSLSQLGKISRGKSTHRPRNDPELFGGDYPFIQTGDVRNAETVLKTYDQTYNEKGLEQSKLWPEGTLCITIAANIADTAVLGIDACFPDSVVGFTTNNEYCNVYFIEIYMRTIQSDLEKYAPATAQKNINLGTLTTLPIPLPPIEEQNEIVERVHRCLSAVESVSNSTTNELTRAKNIKMSILKKAFRGDLIGQDTDESASSQSKQKGNTGGSDTKQQSLDEIVPGGNT